MTKYRVSIHEILTTIYLVDADDEEDALDAVRSGDGEEVNRSAEPLDEFHVPTDGAEEVKE